LGIVVNEVRHFGDQGTPVRQESGGCSHNTHCVSAAGFKNIGWALHGMPPKFDACSSAAVDQW
jgi:hypothetical protein